MLENAEFNISPQCLFEFRDALRNLVNELSEQPGLYPQTLREYLNGLGEILFLGDADSIEAETTMVQFMAVVSEYQVNKEFRYSLQDDSEDDVELE